MNALILQKALNRLGVGMKQSLKLTGVMDDQTIAAVKAFQTANKLSPVDGIVGPSTGTAIAIKLNPQGIPIALAGILDCTDWDTPNGGWSMPKNCTNYKFFRQPIYPGGGFCVDQSKNITLDCGHIQVPWHPTVLKWVEDQVIAIRAADPKGNYFALLIMGLAFGSDYLSDMKPIQAILHKYNIVTVIAEEGTFFYENERTNQTILYNQALKGAKLMVFGHSMGGDEAIKIISGLNREYVLNI